MPTKSRRTVEILTHTGPVKVQAVVRQGGLVVHRALGELGYTITHERSGLAVAGRGTRTDTLRVLDAVLPLTDWTQGPVVLGRVPDLAERVRAVSLS